MAWLVDGRRNEGVWRMEFGRFRRNSEEKETKVGLGPVETRGWDGLGRVLVDLVWQRSLRYLEGQGLAGWLTCLLEVGCVRREGEREKERV